MTWIAYILSEGDHRKSAVEDWARRRQMLLGDLTGETVREAEFNDDGLGRLLKQLGDPEIWRKIEQDLWRQTTIAYELDLERVRLDSTASFGYYYETTAGGLIQFGHSKDHRPDKPQPKLMAAAAEPTAHMIASEVHSGHRADEGPCIPLLPQSPYRSPCYRSSAATQTQCVQVAAHRQRPYGWLGKAAGFTASL